MNLRTPESYWLLKSGLLNVYPSLQGGLKVDFAMMGGGSTGALVPSYLPQAGLKSPFLIVAIGEWAAPCAPPPIDP
jgi:hypothetical protein